MQQYRINYNGADSGVINYSAIDQRWSVIAQVIEDRGGHAVLYQRTVFDDADILDGLTDKTGWLKLNNNKTLSPWVILAELEG